MMDAAATASVALIADGTDAPLMAADHSLRRELADGATASRGDLIVCTRNDHSVEAGEPGRTLANGDLLRIDDITPAGLLVRRQATPHHPPAPRAVPRHRPRDRAATGRPAP